MGLNFFKASAFEQKLLSWATVGLLIFISAFLWAPSRDGLQGVYCLTFFLPMGLLLLSRKPGFNEYGGWIAFSALLYAGFSALSSLWGKNPGDLGFFILQWCVLAVWLCGSSLLFAKRDIDLQQYYSWFVILGGGIIAITVPYYYYGFFISKVNVDSRLFGWNVFRNPNEIGAMCGIVSLLGFTLALQSEKLQRAYLFYFLSAIAAAGLVASFSRGSLLALVLMAIVALICVRPALKIWLPPVLVAVAALIVFLATTHVFDGYAGRTQAIDGRATIWKTVLQLCRENILLGVGMAKNTDIGVTNIGVYNHAHNAWLDTFYRTGLLGLILVLLNLGTVLAKLSRSPKLLPLYLWLGYGCICSLFDSRCFFWEIGAKWFFYWIPIGLIAASLTGISFRARRSEIEK